MKDDDAGSIAGDSDCSGLQCTLLDKAWQWWQNNIVVTIAAEEAYLLTNA